MEAEAVGFILVEAEAVDFLKLEVEAKAEAATNLPLPDTLLRSYNHTIKGGSRSVQKIANQFRNSQ